MHCNCCLTPCFYYPKPHYIHLFRFFFLNFLRIRSPLNFPLKENFSAAFYLSVFLLYLHIILIAVPEQIINTNFHRDTSGDYIIPVGMKFCPVLSRSWECYKFFINYILRLHAKRFIPARLALFSTAGIPLCRDEIFPCNRFSPPKRDEKVN